jgi:hypothetical protein
MSLLGSPPPKVAAGWAAWRACLAIGLADSTSFGERGEAPCRSPRRVFWPGRRGPAASSGSPARSLSGWEVKKVRGIVEGGLTSCRWQGGSASVAERWPCSGSKEGSGGRQPKA